jgi:SAM-dependent methyltransferase
VPETCSHAAGAAFDTIASRYDELWTHSTVGRLQRDAVWRRLNGLFEPGESLLDLGCGTGEDALHFTRLGMRVRAIDASPEMVRMSRRRGVDASILPIEDVQSITECFDGVISNFGALNCVSDLKNLSGQLAAMIRPGGYLALCILGRFCLWETAWYLLQGKPRKASRRWRSGRVASSLRIRVNHFSISQLHQAFSPRFTMVHWCGVGLTVPPSYLSSVPDPLLRVFGAVDRHLAHWPVFRAAADHRLAIFVRN